MHVLLRYELVCYFGGPFVLGGDHKILHTYFMGDPHIMLRNPNRVASGHCTARSLSSNLLYFYFTSVYNFQVNFLLTTMANVHKIVKLLHGAAALVIPRMALFVARNHKSFALLSPPPATSGSERDDKP